MILLKGCKVFRLRKKSVGPVKIDKFITIHAGSIKGAKAFFGEKWGDDDEMGLVYCFKRKNDKSNTVIQMSELDFESVKIGNGSVTVWCLKKNIGQFIDKLERGEYDSFEPTTKKKRSQEQIKSEIARISNACGEDLIKRKKRRRGDRDVQDPRNKTRVSKKRVVKANGNNNRVIKQRPKVDLRDIERLRLHLASFRRKVA